MASPYKPTAFGKYLRKKRTDAGLSLRAVSEKTEISFVFLGEVERGVRPGVARASWEALADAIPGFSVTEAARLSSTDRPIQLSLENAPPKYRDLGLALARTIEKQDLKSRDIDKILDLLKGDNDD
ncbi:MAG TPA: helix-turn-helix transcriptional regulator [Polyangiaceae bacterium]